MEKTSGEVSPGLGYVKLWLYGIAALIFCMVLVGGATRLTDSGLSITEWRPLLGAIPPLTAADWQEAFDKYKLIPEYLTQKTGMSLEEFKFIYWWEWAHRFFGRFIGIAFFLPLLVLAVSGYLTRKLLLRLLVIFVLGGLQGALGWYMVASGLENRVDVSQYRLAAHLTLATIIFAAVLWVAYGLGKPARHAPHEGDRGAVWLVLLIILQVAAGGFVAGLDAGMGYNTWPLMDGKLVPEGLGIMSPLWRNMFENALTVQFNHRLLAYVIAISVAAYAFIHRTPSSYLLLLAVCFQIGLGIWTLLMQVPLWLGLLHQGGALIVLAAALWNLHVVLSRSPVQGRR